jgi:quinol monooxygenase YgiN
MRVYFTKEVWMTEPIVFISHNRVNDGRLEEFKQFFQAGVSLIQSGKPGTLAFLAYVGEEGTRVTIIHVFPDAQAMADHMHGAGDRARKTYEFLTPDSIEIYGQPPQQIIDAMQQAVGPGVRIHLNSKNLGGFLRLYPG